jgi:hypothetical protein
MLLLTLLLRVPKPVLKSKSRRARADFVKAENKSPDRESAASDRVLLGSVETAKYATKASGIRTFSNYAL